MSRARVHNRDPLRQSNSETKANKKDRSTQSETRSTRNVGTMSEFITIGNFGNAAQPQTSATKTSTRHQLPSLEQQYPQPNISHRTPSPTPQPRPSRSQRPRSPSPNQKDPSTYLQKSTTSVQPQHRPHEFQRSPSPPQNRKNTSAYIQHRTPSPQTQTHPFQSQRSRSPSPTRQNVLQPTNLGVTTSPQYRNGTGKPKHRPTMATTETDTSLDGMKSQQHIGVQPEPRSTRDYGTTTMAKTKKQPETNPSTNLNTTASYLQRQASDSSLTKREDLFSTPPSNQQQQQTSLTKREDYFSTPPPPSHQQKTSLKNDPPSSTRKNYLLRPTQNDVYVDNYEKTSSKYAKSTTPEQNNSFNRSILHEPEPITGDHSKPTKSSRKPLSDKEERQANRNFNDEIPDESYISELPRGGSISIAPSTVVQPDTLPRSYIQHVSPPRRNNDDLDSKKKTTDVPIFYGQQQRTTSIKESPVLNIGTENIIRQSPENEFTTPFETHYVYEPNRDFTTNNNNIRSSTLTLDDLRSRNNRTLLLPVINSSRTYVFEKQPLSTNPGRQSRANGNFYLAKSSSVRSLNESFQVNDSGIAKSTQLADSNNLNRYGLQSQEA